ncbi:MAG: MerR family transcriptional regulator [Gemmatimonadota bacterium]|nr:MAG: MerR family transcriptional regulator [Gemmatimonadota bacterium]
MNERQAVTDEKRHPIQVVSRRSGLSPDVLRAWEKRYDAITPARSSGGRRLYSDADVERLRLIQEAMAGGRRIGQLANLDISELTELVQEDRREAVSRPEGGSKQPAHGNPDVYLAECLDAVRALDDNWLKSSFGRAVIALRPDVFMDEVATPLMHRIGTMWSDGQLTPGHEHLASTVIRQTVAEVTNALQPQNGAPRVVVATPAHQRHEIAAMLVAAASAFEGWHVTYLGSDLPAYDIARAAEQTSASAIALSITHPAGDPVIGQELKALRHSAPKTIPILIGGQAASSYRHIIDTIGAVHIENLEALRQTLHALKQND